VEIERDMLEQANNVATLGECFVWMKRCDECIERLEERSRAKCNVPSLIIIIVRKFFFYTPFNNSNVYNVNTFVMFVSTFITRANTSAVIGGGPAA